MDKIVLGILAHVDSGKTTLSEAMLYCTGNISKLGRVDHKNSFLDTFSLERKRGITIFSKQAVLSYKDKEYTLLDTPGHVDFSAEAERTLQVLDYAILVISATDGVQSHTMTLWKLLKKYNIPCFIFVNKMDLDGADKEAVYNSIRRDFGESCIDFSNDNTPEFYENAALCDEALLNYYSENDVIETKLITQAIKERKIFPCFFGCALKLEGIDEFIKLINKYCEMPQYNESFGAKVYKISEDNQGNRLTHIKLTGGSLKVKEILKSDKNINSEKVNQIRIYDGEKYKTCDEVKAGTICAVTGISFTASGDGLGIEKNSFMPILEPVLTYKVNIDDGTDIHTLLSKLRILENEDPQLKVMWNELLGEIQIQLMGDIHLEVLETIIEERFNIKISFGKGNIIYKETILDAVEGVGHFEPLRHYAEVHLILKPTERNSGLSFKRECSEDVLDKNWQRLIITHLYEKTHLGVLTGSPITDMEITLVSGKAHPKHTEGGDFRQATYRAVRQGLASAKSALLEPVYEFRLEVPNENIGRALSDIQQMNGSFEPPEQLEQTAVINGAAPVSEMQDYTKEVLQYTHGKGRLFCSLKGYELCHNSDKVIADIGYSFEADTANTADSVFCSHGAGYNVKWNEVKSHMHLQSALHYENNESSNKKEKLFNKVKNQKDIFALDKELMQIFESTYGPVKSRNAFEPVKRNTAKSNDNNEKYKRAKTLEYEGPDYLLVDGYNVIFSWDSLRELSGESIEGARSRLINILCNYQGYKRCEVILVFDAYKVKGNNREVERVNNINIVYTKEAETADMYIEKVSHKLAKKHKVRVVTSDALEQLIILEGGALRVSSREFLFEVEQAEEEIRKIIEGTI